MRIVASLNAGRPRPEIKCRALGEDVLDMDVKNITEAARHNRNCCIILLTTTNLMMVKIINLFF